MCNGLMEQPGRLSRVKGWGKISIGYERDRWGMVGGPQPELNTLDWIQNVYDFQDLQPIHFPPWLSEFLCRNMQFLQWLNNFLLTQDLDHL
jgi:hypothetical protein